MELTKLATKPELLKVILDDEDTIKEHNEPIEFYVWDKQPLELFVAVATKSQNKDNYGELLTLCSDLILDKDGQPVIKDGLVLPNTLLVKCVNKVVEQLGK
jgi:hypothetical protein